MDVDDARTLFACGDEMMIEESARYRKTRL